MRFRAGGPTRAAAWPFTGDKHPSPDHTHQPTAGDTAWNSAPSTVRVHNGWIRRIGRWVVVIGTALVSGVITLALSTWGALFVVPNAVLSSCSTSSAHNGLEVCTTLSPWRWLLLAIVVAGAAAGGIGMAHLIKPRKRSQDGVLPPGVPISL